MKSGFKRGINACTYGDGESLINLLLVRWDGFCIYVTHILRRIIS